jgi:TolB-like protein
LDHPFEAYEGDEPYVFVCYSHDDKSLVYPELTRLKDAGFHIWYDEGIGPGSEWSDSVARHIEHCASFLYFVTPRSVDREHCRRELNFAIDQSRRVLAVHLVPTELPSGLKLTLSNRQAILKYDGPESAYQAKLGRALGAAAQHDPTRRSNIRAPERPALDRSIAILRLSALGLDAAAATHAEVLTEELRTVIAGYPEIRIVSVRNSTALHDVRDASYVLAGSIQHLRDRVLLRVHLTRTDDRHMVWAKTFEYPREDDNADPATTASTIGRFIRQQLVFDQRCESVRRTARSTEAATAYCAALAENFRYGQIGDMDAQLMLSEAQRAIALDPDIAGAYELIARAYQIFARMGAMDWRDASRNAHDALTRGLALAPNDGSLLAMRGWIQGVIDLNYPAAEASVRASLSREPTDPTNYVLLASLALARGDVNAALEDARRASRIDDSAAPVSLYYSYTLWMAGQNREAIKVADAGLALVQAGPPRDALLLVKTGAYHSLGETAAANAALDDILFSLRPAYRASLTGTLAYIGRTEEARRFLAEGLAAVKDPPIEPMVNAYAQLDHDRAFEWIHKAIDHHIWGVVEGLRSSPVLSEMRNDPRWEAVVAHLESEEAKGRAGQNASRSGT